MYLHYFFTKESRNHPSNIGTPFKMMGMKAYQNVNTYLVMFLVNEMHNTIYEHFYILSNKSHDFITYLEHRFHCTGVADFPQSLLY